MARNYGIGYCRKQLSRLAALERHMFKHEGHGFTWMDNYHKNELQYKRWLKKWLYEREHGLTPSYRPDTHGTLEE